MFAVTQFISFAVCLKLRILFYAFRMLWRKCQHHDTVASLLHCSTVMFARSICGMIMCVLWTLYFYIFILSTELLFTGCLHLFQSFQNHLKGRTHQLMMDKLEESYKIRVELMRHEQKVAN